MTPNPYVAALQAKYADANNNVFISYRNIHDTLTPAPQAIDEHSNVNGLEGKKDSLINASSLEERMKAFSRLEDDAKSLEEAYHKCQIYSISEYVIWNIMCMPVTVAAILEFFIHVGFDDFNWQSEIFLTTFDIGLLGAMLIVYAALAIRVLQKKWNVDIDKSLKQYQKSLVKYLNYFHQGINIDPLMELIKKNVPMIKANWLITATPKEFVKIGFRKNDLYEETQNTVSDKVIAHEERRNKFRAATYLFLGAEIVAVLFTSNLYHTKAEHFRNTFSMTPEQRRKFEEFKEWFKEWQNQHPPGPSVERSSFESADVELTASSATFEPTLNPEALIVAISFAVVFACIVAGYAWKKHHDAENRERPCRQRM